MNLVQKSLAKGSATVPVASVGVPPTERASVWFHRMVNVFTLIAKDLGLLRAQKLFLLLALWLTQMAGHGADSAPAQPPGPRPVEREVEAAEVVLQRNHGILSIKDQPFSGVVVERHPDGTVKSKSPYAAGRLEGESDIWYANGKMAEVRHFKNGWKEGEHKGWWEDGRPRFVFHFKAHFPSRKRAKTP